MGQAAGEIAELIDKMGLVTIPGLTGQQAPVRIAHPGQVFNSFPETYNTAKHFQMQPGLFEESTFQCTFGKEYGCFQLPDGDITIGRQDEPYDFFNISSGEMFLCAQLFQKIGFQDMDLLLEIVTGPDTMPCFKDLRAKEHRQVGAFVTAQMGRNPEKPVPGARLKAGHQVFHTWSNIPFADAVVWSCYDGRSEVLPVMYIIDGSFLSEVK